MYARRPGTQFDRFENVTLGYKTRRESFLLDHVVMEASEIDGLKEIHLKTHVS